MSEMGKFEMDSSDDTSLHRLGGAAFFDNAIRQPAKAIAGTTNLDAHPNLIQAMPRFNRLLALSILVLSVAVVPLRADDLAGIEFFEKRIRPVLVRHCYECHSSETEGEPKGGLRVDWRTAIRQGGDSGPAVVPEDVEQSLLIGAICYEDFEMPPDGRLSDAVIADFKRWVRIGAPDPRDTAPQVSSPAATTAEQPISEASDSDWVYQSPRATVPPQDPTGWARSSIDRFLAAGHRKVGLTPVADAQRTALLRRVYVDLVGLPPTPAAIRQFVNDPSPRAFQRVVDQLLASPQFGQRWGRHWLDIVRFAESTGRTRNFPYPFAWRYRDYVIRSFNADKPYDRFLQEQIAGDLLPADNRAQRRQQLVATGFLALGAYDLNERNVDVYRMDQVGDQLDVIGRAVMGLTLACARCHDHKFDPIPTRDYYALAGILRNTQVFNGYTNRRRANQKRDPDLYLALASKATYDEHWATQTRKSNRRKQKKKQQKAEKAKQPMTGPYAMGVRDRPKITDCAIHIGGDVDRLGEVVPRGFLQAIDVQQPPQVSPTESGRVQLANWLIRPDHPLTARVWVNRVWHHLFGRGIVDTVDNFGAMGRDPSHPELLDTLAVRFIANDWSTKRLIRSIVLSRAYQLSQQASHPQMRLDAENRWVGRMPLRRLEAEAIRDALLSVSGRLDPSRPPSSLVQAMQIRPIRRQRSWAKQAAKYPFRSVYLPVIRSQVPNYLRAFDFPEPSEVKGDRAVTTVATQALFMMNSEFVRRQCERAARRLLQMHADGSPRQLVREAYLLTLNRWPTDTQIDRAIDYARQTRSTGRESGRRVNAPDVMTDLLHALVASAEFRYR